MSGKWKTWGNLLLGVVAIIGAVAGVRQCQLAENPRPQDPVTQPLPVTIVDKPGQPRSGASDEAQPPQGPSDQETAPSQPASPARIRYAKPDEAFYPSEVKAASTLVGTWCPTGPYGGPVTYALTNNGLSFREGTADARVMDLFVSSFVNETIFYLSPRDGRAGDFVQVNSDRRHMIRDLRHMNHGDPSDGFSYGYTPC